MHKYLALAIAVGYTIFLTILSLISIQHMPKLGSTFDDKIYHFGAYIVMTLVWYNFFKRTGQKLKIIFSAIIALTYGIIVEVLQGTFTTYRTEDIMDVFANSVGVLMAVALILVFQKYKVKLD
ncbi:MAG: VanZ family protein [Aquaticitalea sp.]